MPFRGAIKAQVHRNRHGSIIHVKERCGAEETASYNLARPCNLALLPESGVADTSRCEDLVGFMSRWRLEEGGRGCEGKEGKSI